MIESKTCPHDSGDELITLEEYIKKLFGKLPEFLDGEEDPVPPGQVSGICKTLF